ncbi:MAG: FxLYD domain-containing protein [Clostridia bacterium]|nr:FxLYD domain-containing protein [Clostridia bacterium]
MQGFYRGKVTNTSDKTIESKYVRVRSYDDNGTLLQTKYVKLEDMEPGETREFNARFDVGGIDHYDVDYVDEMEDDSTFMDDMFDRVKGFFNKDNYDNDDSIWGWIRGKFRSSGSFMGYDLSASVDDVPDWAWVVSAFVVLTSL